MVARIISHHTASYHIVSRKRIGKHLSVRSIADMYVICTYTWKWLSQMINLLGNVWLYSFSFTVMTLRLVSCGMNKIYKWGFYKSYYTSNMYVPSTYTSFAPWKFSKSLLKSKSFSNIVDFTWSKTSLVHTAVPTAFPSCFVLFMQFYIKTLLFQ